MDGRDLGDAIQGMMFALFFGGLVLGALVGGVAFLLLRWAAAHVSIGLQ